MAARETAPDYFAPTSESRDHAREIIDGRITENEDERRILIRLRDHLAGETPIGEALSFFYGEAKKQFGESAASRDLKVAERVIIDFLKTLLGIAKLGKKDL